MCCYVPSHFFPLYFAFNFFLFFQSISLFHCTYKHTHRHVTSVNLFSCLLFLSFINLILSLSFFSDILLSLLLQIKSIHVMFSWSATELTRFLMLSNLAANLTSFSCLSLMVAISPPSSFFPPNLVGDIWDKASLSSLLFLA